MTDKPKTTPPARPGQTATPDDELLDEALDETFPASDPVQPEHHTPLPPAHPPGSDVHDR